jgi:hypothetical protein
MKNMTLAALPLSKPCNRNVDTLICCFHPAPIFTLLALMLLVYLRRGHTRASDREYIEQR